MAPAYGAVLVVSDRSPHQGETIEISVQAPQQEDAPADAAPVSDKSFSEVVLTGTGGFEEKCRLFASKGEMRALLAIPADLAPGKYTLSFGDDKAPLTVLSG